MLALIVSILLVVSVVVIMAVALKNQKTLEGPMTQFQERFGYPGAEYKQPSEVTFVNDDTRVFVIMSTTPGMVFQAVKALESIPNTLQIQKFLIMDPDMHFTKQDLVYAAKVPVLETKSPVKGPIAKFLTLTDPSFSAQLGLKRNHGSHDILISLDDDMQQHPSLIQDLVTGIEESVFSKVVALKVRNTEFPVQDSKFGVAMPASMWTSAFRGDLLHLLDLSKICAFSDDVPISFALRQMKIPIVKIVFQDKYVKVSSKEFKDKTTMHDECFQSLKTQVPDA